MEANGIWNAVYVTTGLYPKLRLSPLNPIQNAPALNTRRQEENGLMNAVFIPASNSIRVSVV